MVGQPGARIEDREPGQGHVSAQQFSAHGDQVCGISEMDGVLGRGDLSLCHLQLERPSGSGPMSPTDWFVMNAQVLFPLPCLLHLTPAPVADPSALRALPKDSQMSHSTMESRKYLQ
ncbi:hypothetical protein H920_18917 [Fukomys damarensis]|uniref:Uncharacterized protein n=1 Tax=Fukomys damarensis TaxID=885580 RepID=A0A091D9V4_FUKDA|nr:hypothetical protein H920_18917 [Fukomys damarensis]